MLLVRSQEDELHPIESDIHTASIPRCRVSSPYSQRSFDLRSSLKPPSWDPRSPEKFASRTSAVHRVVRLERIQEDEDDDERPTYQPPLPQIAMETNDQIDEMNTGAYTRPAWPPPDGLDQAYSMILDSPTHDLTNPFCFTFDDPENLLYQCRRNPRNIVLDSVWPENTPHVVITPPEFDWTDFSTIDENSLPPQEHPEYYLCVPGFGPTSLFATVLPNETADRGSQAKMLDADSKELEIDTRVDGAVFADGSLPMRVFNRSLFVQMIEITLQERELMPCLLRSLYKRLFSTCAAVASDIARSLSRYSPPDAVPEIFSHLEKPITWSDPALPLLSWFFRLPGTLIIDSPTPFTIPHIVITEPPIWDYNLYVNIHNSTQSPQDAGWGQSLVVPSPLVEFVNLPQDLPVDYVETTTGYSITTEYMELETEGDVSEQECPSECFVVGSPESTTPQTPGLLTPIGEEEEFDLVMFASSPPQNTYLSSVGGHELLLEDAPQDGGMYCDEEEDDDLPPLDDWYQDIAARSGIVLST